MTYLLEVCTNGFSEMYEKIINNIYMRYEISNLVRLQIKIFLLFSVDIYNITIY